MKRPDTLLYPPELIKHTSRQIAKGLRDVFSLFKAARKKGLPMAPSDVKLRGEEVIDKEYEAYIARINGYLIRNELDPITGEEPGFTIRVKDAKEGWGRIVDDLYGA